MKELIDLLNFYRDEYVVHLLKSINRVKNEHEKVASELWVGLSSDSLYKEYYRIDVVSNDEKTKSVEANIDLPSSEGLKQLYHSVPLTVEAFVWNGLDIFIEGVFVDAKDFDRWFTKWFDEEGLFEPDDSGLAGCIHCLSAATDQSGTRLSMDLGSAPVDALVEMLDIIETLSPMGIRLSSEHLKA